MSLTVSERVQSKKNWAQESTSLTHLNTKLCRGRRSGSFVEACCLLLSFSIQDVLCRVIPALDLGPRCSLLFIPRGLVISKGSELLLLLQDHLPWGAEAAGFNRWMNLPRLPWHPSFFGFNCPILTWVQLCIGRCYWPSRFGKRWLGPREFNLVEITIWVRLVHSHSIYLVRFWEGMHTFG